MLKLLFIVPVVALLDPLLLILLWSRLPFWFLVFGLVGLPLLVTVIARRPRDDKQTALVGYIRFFARLLAWYPGPISKLCALILLLPAVERMFLRRAMSAVMGNFSPEQMQAMTGAQTKKQPVKRDENGLKIAPGRVID